MYSLYMPYTSWMAWRSGIQPDSTAKKPSEIITNDGPWIRPFPVIISESSSSSSWEWVQRESGREGLHQVPPLRDWGMWEKGRKSLGVRADGGHQENITHQIKQAGLTWIRRDRSHKLRPARVCPSVSVYVRAWCFF